MEYYFLARDGWGLWHKFLNLFNTNFLDCLVCLQALPKCHHGEAIIENIWQQGNENFDVGA